MLDPTQANMLPAFYLPRQSARSLWWTHSHGNHSGFPVPQHPVLLASRRCISTLSRPLSGWTFYASSPCKDTSTKPIFSRSKDFRAIRPSTSSTLTAGTHCAPHPRHILKACSLQRPPPSMKLPAQFCGQSPSTKGPVDGHVHGV